MEASSKLIVLSRFPSSLSKLKIKFLSSENAIPLLSAIELLSLFRYPSSDLKYKFDRKISPEFENLTFPLSLSSSAFCAFKSPSGKSKDTFPYKSNLLSSVI